MSTINGLILKYYRELEERSVYDISYILGVPEEKIESYEQSNCEVSGDDFKIVQKYCRILRINVLLLFMKDWTAPEERREFFVGERHGYYTVYARKDDLRLSFDVDKEFVVDLIKDLVETVAYEG